MRSERRIGAVLAALVTMAAALIVTAGPAAAVTCHGYGCDNQNPYGTGCNNGSQVIHDAYLTYSDGVGITVESGHVRLHYSPTCRTAWASVYGLPRPVTANWQAYAEVVRSNGTRLYCSVPIGQTSCYTYMVYDGGVTSYAEAYSHQYDTVDGYWAWFFGSTGSY